MADIQILLERINTLTGSRPEFEVGTFETWSRLQVVPDLLMTSPADLDEVKRVICAARQMKLRVRCAGIGHSWSRLFPDPKNVLVRTEKLNRVQPVWDSGMGRVVSVRVQCGATVADVVQYEKAHDFNLGCNVNAPRMTYGGVVATGSHGTGWNLRAISDYVKSMTIVNSDGELKRYSKADDPDMMKAVQCSLGLFGIIYEIELEVVPRKLCMVVNDFERNVAELFYNPQNLRRLVTSHDLVEIYWFPFQSLDPSLHGEWRPANDKAWVRMVDKSNSSPMIGGPATAQIGSSVKGHTKLSRLSYHDCKQFYRNDAHTEDFVDALHYVTREEPCEKVHQTEWAFEVTDDFSTIVAACHQVIALVQRYTNLEECPITLLHIRWMGFSEAYLCQAIVGKPREPSKEGAGHTFFLELHVKTNTRDWEDICNKVTQQWRSIPGITPPRFPWAKEWDFLDGIDDYTRKVYAKEIAQFKECLEKSGADPDGMFLNEKLEGIFYPEAKKARKDPVPSAKL